MSRIGNVSLDRENKRLKLAIKQSETEKLEWKKRHEEQTETLQVQAVLKENNVLHETIRLKNSIEECRDRMNIRQLISFRHCCASNSGQTKS